MESATAVFPFLVPFLLAVPRTQDATRCRITTHLVREVQRMFSDSSPISTRPDPRVPPARSSGLTLHHPWPLPARSDSMIAMVTQIIEACDDGQGVHLVVRPHDTVEIPELMRRLRTAFELDAPTMIIRPGRALVQVDDNRPLVLMGVERFSRHELKYYTSTQRRMLVALSTNADALEQRPAGVQERFAPPIIWPRLSTRDDDINEIIEVCILRVESRLNVRIVKGQKTLNAIRKIDWPSVAALYTAIKRCAQAQKNIGRNIIDIRGITRRPPIPTRKPQAVGT